MLAPCASKSNENLLAHDRRGSLRGTWLCVLRDLLSASVNFQFFGYTLRTTDDRDRDLAIAWNRARLGAEFWLLQGEGRESFLVIQGQEPIAFFQVQNVGRGDQARLHFQASPTTSPKRILRGITKLVPLIEKALALRGVKAIFFTSHSPRMAVFMMERLGYSKAGSGGRDGVMMAKGIQ